MGGAGVLDRYQRAAGAVWRHAHGSVFVLPNRSGDVVVLTGTGQDLWWLLAEPMTVGQVAHRLAEAYEVSADTVTRDVVPILDELARRGVLVGV